MRPSDSSTRSMSRQIHTLALTELHESSVRSTGVEICQAVGYKVPIDLL